MYSEYGSDFARWINLQNEQGFSLKNIDDQYFLIIHKLQDEALAYFFTLEHNYKSHKAQQLIINKKSAKYAFLFAQNIKNADIKALENVVIKSNDPKWATEFACYITGANLSKLEKVIISANKAKYAHMYLKYIDTNSISFNLLKKIILKSKKPSYLFELARHLTSKKDLSRVEDLIIELKSWTYIRLFAKKIKKANLEKLEQAILDSGNKKEIKKFAKDVKESKLKYLSILF